MKKIFLTIIIALFQSVLLVSSYAAGVIGDWTAYPAFTKLTEAVEAGDKVYFLASGDLYSVNTRDESVVTYDKSKTLSDHGIIHIAWCSSAKRLLVLYDNYNIDLLEENGNTLNIADYRLKTMNVDKSVNAVDVYGDFAYLSTGFGIVKINMKRAEIADSYNLGFSVDWTHVDSNRIYAESRSEGCYSALLTSNLQDKSNWVRTAGYTPYDRSVSPDLAQKAETYRPDGPNSNFHVHLKLAHNRIYSLMGHEGEGRTPPSYLQIRSEDGWKTAGHDMSYLTSRRFFGLRSVEIDPKDADHFWVGALSGLFEMKDGRGVYEHYFGNSPMEYAYSIGASHVNYTIVSSTTMDSEGSIWCFNCEGEHPALHKLTKSGDWISYPHSELAGNGTDMSFSNVYDMFIDSRNLMWFVSSDHTRPGLVRYNIATDEVMVFDDILNQDGAKFPFANGQAVVEDKEGNIWFGTDLGLILLPADRVMTNDQVLEQVKVPRNDGTNLADYLMSGVNINSIAIDGGNRKWIATNGMGVFVISSDNMEQVHHFTSSNSPLLSDYVRDVAIDPLTGEVFFATEVGLCSYRMDATEGSETLESNGMYAYPNPVTPDYTGPITIAGLTYNSYVKIVTVSGQLVAEGRSNGGTFVWDGCNLDGKPVASGVYMVLASTEDASKGAVCKVAIVR